MKEPPPLPIDMFLSDKRLDIPERIVDGFRTRGVIILEDLLKLSVTEILRTKNVMRRDIFILEEILQDAGHRIEELAPRPKD